MRPWGKLAAAAAVTAVLGGSVAHAAPPCPDPRTCTSSTPVGAEGWSVKWPASRDGLVRIPFFINPVQGWLSKSDAINAILTSARTWEKYNPRVRFVYKGETSLLPIPFDGINVVGWAENTRANPREDNYGKLVEFDVSFAAASRWVWRPCGWRNGSCTNLEPFLRTPNDITVYPNELQNIATHELGHALGLGDLNGPLECAMTMSGGVQVWTPSNNEAVQQWCGTVNVRRASTLGFGDVLGLRRLYPWNCPRLRRGQRYPTAYAYICPRIQLFVP